MITKEIDTPKPIDENDPSIQVRTDLWSTMNMTQLNRQRELLLDKISKVQSIMGASANPSLINMYGALQMGLKDLNKLIDDKYAQKINPNGKG
jgi:hypothetical protein